MLQFPIKIRNGLPRKFRSEVLLGKRQWIFLLPELGGTQQRFAKDLAYIPFGVDAVDNEGASLPLYEKVEVGGEFEFGEIDPQGGAHVATESIDGDDVDGGDVEAEVHGVFDGFGGDAELDRADGRGVDGNAAAGEFGDVEEGHGFVSFVDFDAVDFEQGGGMSEEIGFVGGDHDGSVGGSAIGDGGEGAALLEFVGVDGEVAGFVGGANVDGFDLVLVLSLSVGGGFVAARSVREGQLLCLVVRRCSLLLILPFLL